MYSNDDDMAAAIKACAAATGEMLCLMSLPEVYVENISLSLARYFYVGEKLWQMPRPEYVENLPLSPFLPPSLPSSLSLFLTHSLALSLSLSLYVYIGEKLWQMPLPEEYVENIKSKIADLKNIGVKGGGSITAALFLKVCVCVRREREREREREYLDNPEVTEGR
jgi:hypothetical protein